MSLTKVVNGKRVDCSSEEEAKITSEWAENASRKSVDRSNAQAKKVLVENAKTALSTRGNGPVTRAEFNALLDILGL